MKSRELFTAFLFIVLSGAESLYLGGIQPPHVRFGF
jgi:hypothetical protein